MTEEKTTIISTKCYSVKIKGLGGDSGTPTS